MISNTTPEQETDPALIDIETGVLLEALFLYTGFDFRAFRPDYLKERVLGFMAAEGLLTVSAVQDRVLHDNGSMDRFLQSFPFGPDSVFYEPRFFLELRRKVVPLLSSGAGARAWVAGCANGSEVYSLAILLREEGVREKTKVYASGKTGGRTAEAEEGMVPLSAVKGRGQAYRASGGTKTLPAYYAPDTGYARMDPSLRQNLVWTQHNLVTDASFNQFHCILCRNVFGLFTEPLAERVHKLLYESLTIGGLLGLSSGDEIHSPYGRCYEPLKGSRYWYRKTR